MMFRHILVPTDLTDRTVQTLDVAIDIAAGDDAHVTLLHVIETIAGAEFEEFADFYATLETRARERLNDLVTRSRRTRGPVDVAIVYGNRTEEVLRFARSDAIDLIVLASHPLDPGQPHRGLGTMSYKLGILAPCAVLLVK
jgi:nucleotide-binding universal stress UspA family protein